MADRVTIKDIANELRVSTTTVSKALNGQPKISDEMRALVQSTAERMGYEPNHIARAMALAEVRIGVLFFSHPKEYCKQIEYGCYQGIRELSDYHVSIVPKYIPEILSEFAINTALRELMEEKVDGIILTGASDHSYMFDETLHQLEERGIPILITTGKKGNTTSIAQINMDADVAGAMAAQFLSMILPPRASVVLLSGVGDVSHTESSIHSFMQTAYQYNLSVHGIHSTNDDEHIAYYLVEKLLKNTPELAGIYVNHFNSVSVCECLEDFGRTDIVVIGHDLYPELVKKIEKGSLRATLFSNPCEIGRKSIRYLFRYLLSNRALPKPYIEKIPPVLVMRSNLSSYREHLSIDFD